MKHIILLIFGLNCLFGCQNKSTNTAAKHNPNEVAKIDTTGNKSEIKGDQIIFGVYCGECSNHCATMYRYVMNGNQNSFSADSTDSYFKKTELVFETDLNDKFHFDIGKEIFSNIPDKLLNSVKTSEQFGCPDCTDGCGIYFEITIEGRKRKFDIDYQTANLKGDIKTFAEFLKDRIRKLEEKNHY